jgi:8-oxo-dGTP pyrophosphatase MutT (NUDIX family)
MVIKYFQQFFLQKFRPGVFVVVYCKNSLNEVEYLLLKRKLHWVGWEFVKGKIESGETLVDCVKREVKEETGICIRRDKIVDRKLNGKYFYKEVLNDRPQYVGQTFHLFSVEVEKPKNILFDKLEHSGSKWLKFLDAFNLLTNKNQKECLKIVNKEILLNR